MLEKQNQPFEMSGFELAVDVVERMRNRMGDARFLEITLQVENVLSQCRDFRMLRFGDSPDEQMNFTRILWEIGRNFLTNKCMLEIFYLKVAIDRVVISDRDKVHPTPADQRIEISWIGITVWKIESAK